MRIWKVVINFEIKIETYYDWILVSNTIFGLIQSVSIPFLLENGWYETSQNHQSLVSNAINCVKGWFTNQVLDLHSKHLSAFWGLIDLTLIGAGFFGS